MVYRNNLNSVGSLCAGGELCLITIFPAWHNPINKETVQAFDTSTQRQFIRTANMDYWATTERAISPAVYETTAAVGTLWSWLFLEPSLIFLKGCQTLEVFSSYVVFCQTCGLECALLRKSKDWIQPLPLHKGVIKLTIRTFIESETKHNRELHTEILEDLLERPSTL